MRKYFASLLASFATGLFVSTSFSTCATLHFGNVQLEHLCVITPAQGLSRYFSDNNVAGGNVFRVWGYDDKIEMTKLTHEYDKLVVVYHHITENVAKARVLACDHRITEILKGQHKMYRIYLFKQPPKEHGLPEGPKEASKPIQLTQSKVPSQPWITI